MPKYNLQDAHQFGWEGLKGWAYNSKEDFANASAGYFEVTGKHGKIKTVKSDRIYLVLDGKGKFLIDKEEFPVVKHDVVIVPKDTPYDYEATEGTMKLFLVHTPAYDPKDDIKL